MPRSCTTPPRSTARLAAAAVPWILAISAACAPLPPSTAEPGEARPGPLVIVGGGLSPENGPVFREILARKLDLGPICVLPTASADPVESARGYVRDFERYGGEGAAVAVDLTTRSADKARELSFAAQLERCGGFFFTGGDQSRIVDVLRPEGGDTPAAAALRRSHRRGAVVAGSSAGAAMMSDPMIGAGSSEDALRHGVSDEESGSGVWVREGMGFLEPGLTGQHFLARGRLGRHLVALAAHPSERLGIGVDEDTAAILDGDRVTVVGRSQVAVTVVDRDASDTGLRGRFWLLGDGDAFHLADESAAPGPHKRTVSAGGAAPEPPARPFENDRMHRFLIALARSSGREAAVEADGATLSFEKDQGFAAWTVEEPSDESAPAGFGAGPFVFNLSVPETAR
jgi:cyanophycinase